MEDAELQAQLSARFKELPQKVRDAITSADIEAHLRQLAEKHKLHLDQWALLENEVMLTMLGFQKTADLAKNIASEVGVQEDVADALAADISQNVFAPIRDELEKALNAGEEAPKPPAPSEIPVETAPEAAPEVAPAVIAAEAAPAPVPAPAAPQPAPAPIIPATPPPPAPEKKVDRAPAAANYSARVPSHERKEISGDPYREQVI